MSPPKSPLRGRCVNHISQTLWIRNSTGTHQATLNHETHEIRATQEANDVTIGLGDLVEISNGQARVLTPNRQPTRSTLWADRILSPRRLNAMKVRAKVESAIRDFFYSEEFLETHTPLLVPCPGMETHIRTFKTEQGAYLPTSPEFAMKRLLVGGLEKIFQISPAFRFEPKSTTHHPEFTLLEWYRAYATYEQIMEDTERLFFFIAQKLSASGSIQFQGKQISVKPPWPRYEVRTLFLELGVDLVKAKTKTSLLSECKRLGLGTSGTDTWDDLYFRIWLNLIEPRLPKDQAVFVTRYPESQAALAVIDKDPDGSRWARRFEVYAGGLELGNAFQELTDPVEQRTRFERDMNEREAIYGSDFPKTPIDEEFLSALEEGMPPSSGIAVGVDRMIMLFADEPEIENTIWLNSLGAPSSLTPVNDSDNDTI